MKKKIFFIIVIIFLAALGLGKEVDAKESCEDIIDISVNYSDEYTYTNDTNEEYLFIGHIIVKTLPLNGYTRFVLSNSGEDDMLFVFTRTPEVEKFLYRGKEDYKYIKVPSHSFVNYDSYDKINDEFPYNYVSIAPFDTFLLDPGETTSYTLHSYGSITMAKECISFRKEAYRNISDVLDFDPTDYSYVLGVVSMYNCEVELLDGPYTMSYGENEYVYGIRDSVGNYVERTVILNKVHDSAPIITAKTQSVPIDIKNPKSLKEIIAENFEAFDEVDGDINGRIRVSETSYDPQNLEVGVYKSKLEVNDRYGFSSTLDFDIVVFDSTGMIDNYEITTSYTRELEYDEIVELAGLDKKCTYEVIEENYSETPELIGEYYFYMNVINEYGYEYPIDLVINVVDDVAPVVNVLNISTTTSTTITEDIIKSYISVSDYSKTFINIDSSKYISDTVGSYEVYVRVSDAYDNTTVAVIIINVSASDKINYYNSRIRVYNDSALSQAEVIEFLRDISSNSYDSETTSYVESDYFETPLVVGTYTATLITTLPSGVEVREEYIIEVHEVTKEKHKKKKNFFQRIFSAIVNIFKAIGRFFRRIFKFLF